jgi:hypothetical protein
MATKTSTSRGKGKTVAKKAAAKRKVKRVVPVEPDRPKTTLERVRKLREERTRLGLKRLELYVHHDDWEQVKELVAALQSMRAGAGS